MSVARYRLHRYRHINTSYLAEHAFSYVELDSYRRLGYRQRTLHIAIIGMYEAENYYVDMYA